jgi:hypothetical protein
VHEGVVPALASATCQIKQVIGGEVAKAQATGELSFTGITVSEPAGCSAASELTTNDLVAEVITVGGKTKVKFSPESGTTFANVSLTGAPSRKPTR